RIKRPCGVLYIPAEGVGEVRKRLTALVKEKCGGMQRAPFRWYEAAPTLLGPNAAEDADRHGAAGGGVPAAGIRAAARPDRDRHRGGQCRLCPAGCRKRRRCR